MNASEVATLRALAAADAARVHGVDMCCPACRSNQLATIERLVGSGSLHAVIRLPDGSVHIHWGDTPTVVHWPSSTTAGVSCRDCGWAYEGADWPTHLTPASDGGAR